jgi:archaellum component FlaF (FlaF/FlaG flagellin family)
MVAIAQRPENDMGVTPDQLELRVTKAESALKDVFANALDTKLGNVESKLEKHLQNIESEVVGIRERLARIETIERLIGVLVAFAVLKPYLMPLIENILSVHKG